MATHHLHHLLIFQGIANSSVLPFIVEKLHQFENYLHHHRDLAITMETTCLGVALEIPLYAYIYKGRGISFGIGARDRMMVHNKDVIFLSCYCTPTQQYKGFKMSLIGSAKMFVSRGQIHKQHICI